MNAPVNPNVAAFERKALQRFLVVPAVPSAFTPFYSAEAGDEEAQASNSLGAGASEAA